MGVVLKDYKGKMIAAGNRMIEYCSDDLIVEAIALKFGLLLATLASCNRMIVNSDMEVITTMNEGERSPGAGADIFYDCYHMVCNFVEISFETALEKLI